GQRFQATEFHIEGDWSAAAMLLVAGAVAGEATVENVRMLSKQADTAVCEALVRAGASVISDADSVTAEARPLQAFEFDATLCPDLFPALAALAAAAEGTSTLRGTSRLVSKECDRATAIREEYGKLGIEVELAEPDTMRIRGGTICGGRVDSHSDHRMAMSLAVAALRADGPVAIDGAECVAKSFPDFFEVLDRMKLK
ncbi:MAG: 3-phosphoshikimate 1-carboxyvinyltransferase, partial [Alistipes sp.]|nr:3-phosphoshikimate 1-carboxyvinyltransferase [Alistipes sp.]